MNPCSYPIKCQKKWHNEKGHESIGDTIRCACIICVATLALGSQPMQGLTKLQAKNEARVSHFMLLGVWEGVKK